MSVLPYISEPQVEIDGDSSPELMKDILKIVVEESLHLPAMFTIVLHNNYIPTGGGETEPWRHQKHLEIGKKVKIGFGSATTKDSHFSDRKTSQLIEGEITAIDVEFTNKSESHIYLRGYDASHRLHRGCHNRSFLNMSDADVVKQVAGDAGLQVECGGANDSKEYIFQENQTNMEFLRDLAARNGFELFVQDNKLHFRQPKAESNLTLKWLKDINSFNVRVTSAQQVQSVEVRGWDYKNKEAIVETAESEEVVTELSQNGKGSQASTKFKGLKSPKMIIVNQPVDCPEDAQTIAQACCNELGGEFVYADAKADKNGNPEIRPGKVVQLEDLGKYSGKYYVTDTRHIYQEKVYSTHFSVRGLREGNLLSTLAPKTHLKPGQTLLVGIVTNNEDPEGWGRVKVKLPTLTEEHESHWARVVTIGAGKDRGFDCLPEVDDEVLVAFENGNIHRPYVIGNVWNGKDELPENVDDTIQEGKVRLRTFRTRIGHQFQFVEEDKGESKSGIYLETKEGHKVYLNDSEQYIEIQTKDGHVVRMDDKSKCIEIKSKDKHTVRMDDQNKSIEVKSNSGHILKLDDRGRSVTLESKGNMDIKASGIIKIEGKMIYLN